MNRRTALQSLLGAIATGSLLPRSLVAAGPARSVEFSPFQIDIAPSLLRDLADRVDNFRWPEQGFDDGWSAGTDLSFLRQLVRYWRDEYDWASVQRELNRHEHLRGPVEGDDLHLVRIGGGKGGNPILLLHGWPSSFLEFLPAAELLGPDGAGFQLIIPSLPGFAFSAPPSVPGVGADGIAHRLHRMMMDLGYTRYGVQGGDWGAIIGTQLARHYPESVAGLHLNFVASSPLPSAGAEQGEAEQAYRAERERFQRDETGYSSIQATRPGTLTYAQSDSPVGLLAWIVEKYWAWGDHGGDVWSAFDRDTLLTTAMLYWLPNRALSAARIYYETRAEGIPGGYVDVPTAYAEFPREPWGPPAEVVARTYNLVRHNTFDRGGHFPALEQTRPWAADVAEFFGSLS